MKIDDLKGISEERKLTMLTAYDYQMAGILSKAGIDIILVGDSLGMVVLGYPDTRSVTLDDMIRHGRAVVKGARERGESLVVVDMPINTYNDPEIAVKNCQKVIDETGCDGVKLEGEPEIVKSVVDAGINVMGHTGLKPQSAKTYKLQGKNEEDAENVLKESVELEKVGCFALVLECIPASLTKIIEQNLKIPTIGIGASHLASGQVLVLNDMLGLNKKFAPKFLRRFADLENQVFDAVQEYKKAVISEDFPSVNESY